MQLSLSATLSVLLTLFLTLRYSSRNAQCNQSWAEMLGLNAFALFKTSVWLSFIFRCSAPSCKSTVSNTFLHSSSVKIPRLPAYRRARGADASIRRFSECCLSLFIPTSLAATAFEYVMLCQYCGVDAALCLFAFGGSRRRSALYCWCCDRYGCAFDF